MRWADVKCISSKYGRTKGGGGTGCASSPTCPRPVAPRIPQRNSAVLVLHVLMSIPVPPTILLEIYCDLRNNSLVGHSPKVANLYTKSVTRINVEIRVYKSNLVRSFFCALFEPACLVLDTGPRSVEGEVSARASSSFPPRWREAWRVLEAFVRSAARASGSAA